MTGEEKALVILESMNKYFQIDWAKEDWYVKAISEGLNEIDEKEGKKKTDLPASHNQSSH